MKKTVYALMLTFALSALPVPEASAQSGLTGGEGSASSLLAYAGGDHKHKRHHHDDDDDHWKHNAKKRHDDYKDYRKAQKKYWKAEKKCREAQHRYNRHGGHHGRLPDMVRRAARGGRDVRVWQVSPDTYVVRYYRGNRWYQQYLYPEANRYGGVTVNVTADPSRGWKLIPSVELNLPF